MDEEREYYPHRAYTYLIKMMEYRQIVLSDYGYGTKQALDQGTFTRNFQERRYCLLIGKDAPDKERRYEHTRNNETVEPETRKLPTTTYVLLVVPDSPDLLSADTLRKLLHTVKLDQPNQHHNSEVLLVHRTLAEVRSDGSVRGEEGKLKTHVLKTLRGYECQGIWRDKKKGSEVPDLGTQRGWMMFQPIPYDYVLHEKPRHVSMPKHEIMSEEQEISVLKELRLTRSQLEHIAHDDVAGIWYGLVPGMIVKITVESEVGGRMLKYRYVRPGKTLG